MFDLAEVKRQMMGKEATRRAAFPRQVQVRISSYSVLGYFLL